VTIRQFLFGLPGQRLGDIGRFFLNKPVGQDAAEPFRFMGNAPLVLNANDGKAVSSEPNRRQMPQVGTK
jgi:hypothetical protein